MLAVDVKQFFKGVKFAPKLTSSTPITVELDVGTLTFPDVEPGKMTFVFVCLFDNTPHGAKLGLCRSTIYSKFFQIFHWRLAKFSQIF